MRFRHLLHLLHIHDSAFPIGSYTHSFGMETFIQQGLITTKEELYQFCLSFLQHNLACGDGILVSLAYRALQNKDWGKLLELEQICQGMKIASESRSASLKMGRQFYQTISKLEHHAVEIQDCLLQYQSKLQLKQLKGHYSIIYGIYTAALGIDPELALLTYLQSSLNTLVHNAVRAVPLGQNSGVQTIHQLHADVELLVPSILNKNIADLTTRSVGVELRAMQHQFLYTRLFIS